MRKYNGVLLVLVLLVLLGGCAGRLQRGGVSKLFSDRASDDAQTQGTQPTATEALEALTDAQSTAKPEASSAQESDASKENAFALDRVAQSNRHQGGWLAQAEEWTYMTGPDYVGLYLVSSDGEISAQVSPYFASNLTYQDGYVYYISYEYDTAPSCFNRVAVGSAVSEQLQYSAFEDFFIMDGELYFYGKATVIAEEGYIDIDWSTLYRAPLGDPSLATAVYSGGKIDSAWGVDGRILLLTSRETSDEAYANTWNIIELDPLSGDWSMLYTTMDSHVAMMPYGDMFVMNPYTYDLSPGKECVRYGLLVDQPLEPVFEGWGGFSAGADGQYAIIGQGEGIGSYTQLLIHTRNWGKDQEVLLDLDAYIPNGCYPKTALFRAGNALYLYIQAQPDDLESWGDSMIVRYDLDSGAHYKMDSFD